MKNEIATRPSQSFFTIDELIASVCKALNDVGLPKTAQKQALGVDIIETFDQRTDDGAWPRECWVEAFRNAVNNSEEAADKFPGLCEVLVSENYITIAGE